VRGLATKLASRHPRHIATDQVVPTHDASAALVVTILALVGQGDRVVVPEPTYGLHADQVAMAGGTIIWVRAR